MKQHVYPCMYSDEESYWWYVARRTIIMDQVDSLIASEAKDPGRMGWRLLDFGCGTGRNLLELEKRGIACGLDASAVALEFCRKRGLQQVALIDPQQLSRGENPFGEPFDLVLIADVLEHVPDDEGALRQLALLLRPGGLLLITAPAYEFLWSGEDFVSQHERRYTARRLARLVRAAGYDIVRLTYFNSILFPIQVAAILWNRVFHPKSLYRTSVVQLPHGVNSVLTRIFSLESAVIKRMRLPLGGSILCCGRRRTP